jgi:hypothetical protein
MRERAGRKPICQARVHRELFVEFSRRGGARARARRTLGILPLARMEFFCGARQKAEAGLKKSRYTLKYSPRPARLLKKEVIFLFLFFFQSSLPPRSWFSVT